MKMQIKAVLPVLLLVIHVNQTENYKIVVNIPRNAHSHIEFMGRLADVFVEARHDVVLVISRFFNIYQTLRRSLLSNFCQIS